MNKQPLFLNYIVFSILTVFLSLQSVYAEEIATTESGQKVLLKDNGRYEFIKKSSSVKYKSMTIEDFLIDQKTLIDHYVKVYGKIRFQELSGRYIGFISRNGPYSGSGQEIEILTDNLDRNSKRKAFSCESWCSYTVEGRVVEGQYSTSGSRIDAHKLY